MTVPPTILVLFVRSHTWYFPQIWLFSRIFAPINLDFGLTMTVGGREPCQSLIMGGVVSLPTKLGEKDSPAYMCRHFL